LMRKEPNYTCMLKNLLKLYCIWTWDTLCVFFVFCFHAVLFYFMHPLWWNNYRTTSEAPSPWLETEMDTKIVKTKTSLHLNLEVFVLVLLLLFFIFYFSFCFIFFIYILLSFTYFLFLFLSLFFSFFIFNPLSDSLRPVQFTVN
jgi:hypothetical protein